MDILIKKKELKKSGIEECLINWGGELLAYDPPKYCYKSSLVFHQNIDMSYYMNIIKDKLNLDDYISLTIESDQLKELDKLIYKKQSVYTNEMVLFIIRMFEVLKEFYIIKLLDEEHIDEKYVVSNASDAINVLIESLQRNCPKGVLIIKKGEIYTC